MHGPRGQSYGVHVTYGRTVVKICLLSIAILLLAVSPGRADQIVNGSFENFVVTILTTSQHRYHRVDNQWKQRWESK